jgi:hypothetical protein
VFVDKKKINESIVEEAGLAGLKRLGFVVKHGPETVPGELFAERQEYSQVMLGQRLRTPLSGKILFWQESR